MKIAVCAKQVPLRNEGGMDSETGLIKRGSLTPATNTYDLAAIETALQIRDMTEEASVEVFTMAPKRGSEVLVHAYSMGADKGYLICDRNFGGADVLATSYTLSCGLEKADNYDLIICGKQTTDGDTGQVGSGIAAWLGIPYLSNVSKIVDISEKTAVLQQVLDNVEYEVKVDYPCVLSVLKEIYTPRIPTLTLKIKGKKKEFTTLKAGDLPDCDIDRTGSKGSPTRVVKVYPTPVTEKRDLINTDYKKASRLILDSVEEVFKK